MVAALLAAAPAPGVLGAQVPAVPARAAAAHKRLNRARQAVNPMMNRTTHEIMMPAPGMPMPPPANRAAPLGVSREPAPAPQSH